jgi:hypothetical protein
MKERKPTPEGVIRALNVHKANGLIRGWQRNPLAPWPNGSIRPFSVFVEPAGNGDTVELKNLREASLFCDALASAHHGILKLLDKYALTDSVREALPTRLHDSVEGMSFRESGGIGQ